MLCALGQLEMAESFIKPGDLPDEASAKLHTAMFYLMAVIEQIKNPQQELSALVAAIK